MVRASSGPKSVAAPRSREAHSPWPLPRSQATRPTRSGPGTHISRSVASPVTTRRTEESSPTAGRSAPT